MFQGIKSEIRPISYPKKREILVFKAKCQKIFSRIGSLPQNFCSGTPLQFKLGPLDRQDFHGSNGVRHNRQIVAVHPQFLQDLR